MEIKEIKNGKYNLLTRELKFDSNIGKIEMKPKEALEIVFTIFDCFEMDYTVLYELESRILGYEDKERKDEADG